MFLGLVFRGLELLRWFQGPRPGAPVGLLTGPPGSKESFLIKRWSKSQGFIGEHDATIDVTGGILLKVECASEIAGAADHVWFIDGKVPSRMLEILSDGDTVGTRIVLGD